MTEIIERTASDFDIDEILRKLNSDHSDDIYDDIIVDGFKFTYNQESCHHSEKVTATLSGEFGCYEREGVKEISYERWIGTHWYDWECK